jgi:hypothetical protein
VPEPSGFTGKRRMLAPAVANPAPEMSPVSTGSVPDAGAQPPRGWPLEFSCAAAAELAGRAIPWTQPLAMPQVGRKATRLGAGANPHRR